MIKIKQNTRFIDQAHYRVSRPTLVNSHNTANVHDYFTLRSMDGVKEEIRKGMVGKWTVSIAVFSVMTVSSYKSTAQKISLGGKYCTRAYHIEFRETMEVSVPED